MRASVQSNNAPPVTRQCFPQKTAVKMGRLTGIEPATSGTTNHGSHSNLADFSRFARVGFLVWLPDVPAISRFAVHHEQGSAGLQEMTMCTTGNLSAADILNAYDGKDRS